ncbi:hypothetical protein [Burkholderia plantarii]|uniref:hypothetical protein n=1 Tax=Burkholderia plantarii TaxID=41899 RepID=UPI000870B602|nr:hypothetical protein [Burkholderia plantarii]
MNAISLQVERDELAPASIIVERLKLIRGDKKQTDELAKAVGWSSDMAEKICAGTTGVVAERMAMFLSHLGLVVTTKEYMDYLARGNVIGSNCHCARANMGECGRR